MKKLLLLVVVTLVFTFTALAQAGSMGQGSTGQTTSSTSKETKSKGAASDTKAATKSETKATTKKTGAAKSNSITGCLGKSDGGYTIANGNYKDGIEVTTDKDLSAHVGHKVKLTGTLNKEGAKPSFTATDMKHIADTCTVAGGAKKGAKASKSSGDSAAAAKKSSGDTSAAPKATPK